MNSTGHPGDESENDPPFESKRFQANSVPVSLEVLLMEIDRCRQIMLRSKEIANLATSTRTDYGDAIKTRDRRELDAVIDIYWKDVIESAKVTLDELGGIDDEADSSDLIYPMTKEEALTLQDIILRKVGEGVFQSHFANYQTDYAKIQYVRSKIRFGPDGGYERMFGEALIPLLVTRIEEFLAAVIRSGLYLYQNALGELPDVPNAILRRYQQNIYSSDILRWQLDSKVRDFLKGTPEDWRQSILRFAKIDLSLLGADWDMIVELIQRRHAIIHNGGRADANYLKNVASRLKAGLELGSILTCSIRYMVPMLVELETWAICLSIYWTKHFFGESGRYHPDIIGRVVDLERANRWSQGLAIVSAVLREPLTGDADYSLAQINKWFCLQQLGRDDEAQEREITQWKLDAEKLDSDDITRFDMGRMALLRDYEGLVEKIRQALTGNTPLSKKTLREMPLIDRAMREDFTVRALLQGHDRSPVRSNPKAYQRRYGHSGRRK